MDKSSKKNSIENFFQKLSNIDKGIAVAIILFIIVVLIFFIDNNKIKNSEELRIKKELANIQKEFTDIVENIKSEYKEPLTIKASSINTETSGVTSAKGEVVFILQDGVTGRIVFNDLRNAGTDYYFGRKLPIYEQDTIWYVDNNGILILQVGNKTYKDGEIKSENFNENIEIKTNINRNLGDIKVTLEIAIRYDKEIMNVTINGEKIQGVTKDKNGTNIVIKEVSKNGEYNIVVIAEDGSVNKSVVKVDQINQNVK